MKFLFWKVIFANKDITDVCFFFFTLRYVQFFVCFISYAKQCVEFLIKSIKRPTTERPEINKHKFTANNLVKLFSVGTITFYIGKLKNELGVNGRANLIHSL